jgi:hypothetical protein
VQAIFSNLGQIRSFHQILLPQFERAVTATDFADTFIKYSDFFKLYTSYINSYDRYMDSVTLLRSYKKLNAVLEAGRDRLKGRDITSYLITPVQRIPRFELLIREVLRTCKASTSTGDCVGTGADSAACSEEEREERERLEFALDKVKAVALIINEDKRQAERKSKFMELAATLVDLDKELKGAPLLEAHRHFVMEGTLTDISKKKLRHCVLFNDMFLWCSLPKLRVKGIVRTGHCTFLDHSSDPAESREYSVQDVASLFPELQAGPDAAAADDDDDDDDVDHDGAQPQHPESPSSLARRGSVSTSAPVATAGLVSPALSPTNAGAGAIGHLDALPPPSAAAAADAADADGSGSPVLAPATALEIAESKSGSAEPLSLSSLGAATAAAAAAAAAAATTSMGATVGQGGYVRASPAPRSRAVAAAAGSRPGSRAGSRAPSLGRGSRAASPAPGYTGDSGLHVEFRWVSGEGRSARPVALRLAAASAEDKNEWCSNVLDAMRELAWIRPGLLPERSGDAAAAGAGAGATGSAAGAGTSGAGAGAGGFDSADSFSGSFSASGATPVAPGTPGRRGSLGGAGPGGLMRSPKRFSMGGLGAYSTLSAPIGPAAAAAAANNSNAPPVTPLAAPALLSGLSGGGRPGSAAGSRASTPVGLRSLRPLQQPTAGTVPASVLSAALAAGPAAAAAAYPSGAGAFGNVAIAGDGISPTSAAAAAAAAAAPGATVTPRIAPRAGGSLLTQMQTPAGARTAARRALLAAAAVGSAPTPAPASANAHAVPTPRAGAAAGATGAPIGGPRSGFGAPAPLPGQRRQFSNVSSTIPRPATAGAPGSPPHHGSPPRRTGPAGLQLSPAGSHSRSPRKTPSPSKRPASAAVAGGSPSGFAARSGAGGAGSPPGGGALASRLAALSLGQQSPPDAGSSSAAAAARRRSAGAPSGSGLRSPMSSRGATGAGLRSPGGFGARSPMHGTSAGSGAGAEVPRSRARGRGFTFGQHSPPTAGAGAAGGSPRSPAPRGGMRSPGGGLKSPGSPELGAGKENRKARRRSGCNQQ